jgi:HlyD family type I secretion membrane fusion protein
MVSEHHWLRPIHSDEFLPPISRWTFLGGILLSGTIGVAVLLAAVVRYNVTVKAPAVVRPVGEVQIVQAPLEGTIDSIEVKENQTVRRGDIIAKIDDSDLQTQKRQLQEAIAQNQAQLAQIAAQINALDTQRVAEVSLMNRSISAAKADLNLNQRNYQTQRVSTQAEVREAEAALELARVEMEQYQQLSETGAVAQLQIRQKEQAFKATQARLERMRAALNPSSAEVIMAQERIAQETARGESMLATLNQKREQLRQQQAELQGQINRDRQALQKIETDLKETVIRAPVDGMVFRLGIRNSAQVVKSGDLVAQVAPDNSPLVVKAQVLPQDISKVSICDQADIADCKTGRVQLRISAYPHSDYGTLKGAVRAISPDAITPNSNGTNAASPYYEVTIEPEYRYLKRAEQQYLLKSGMDATADILAKEETVLTFLLRKAKLLGDVY